jgi:hypothetical protein
VVRGLEYFREYFKDFQESYVLIGGVACDLAMEQAGLGFRATKDLDIVLCAEAIDGKFVAKFWEFVKEGGYEHQEKSTGEKQFYRFNKPANDMFPFMLELFSRKLDDMTLDDDSHLTPIPTDADVLSLSAILLDDDYYQCIEKGKTLIDGVSILGAEYILLFKARAWLDLTKRKKSGDKVDSRDIKKHRSDVFRVFTLLSPAQRVDIPESIKADMREFVAAMPDEENLDIKELGINTITLTAVIASVSNIYNLGLN